MNLKSIGLLILLVLVATGLYGQSEQHLSQNAPQWRVVFQNDAKGKPLYGDIKQLIAAVRAGVPIRLAWASKRPNEPISVEHVVDAHFLTVMSETIVQAQIHRIYGQNPDFKNKIMKFRDAPLNYWSAILSTNGKAAMLNFDIESGKLVGQNERTMGVIWYALIPGEGLPMPKPLWESRR